MHKFKLKSQFNSHHVISSQALNQTPKLKKISNSKIKLKRFKKIYRIEELEKLMLKSTDETCKTEGDTTGKVTAMEGRVTTGYPREKKVGNAYGDSVLACRN